MKLDKAFLDAVESPIHSTWQAIACDVVGIEGYRSTYSGNMEMVLDANRLTMYGGYFKGWKTNSKTGVAVGAGKAADDLVGQACKEHGYAKVSRFLCRHIKLST